MDKKEKLEALGVKFVPVNLNELAILIPNRNYSYKQDEINKRKINSITYSDIKINVGETFNVLLESHNLRYKVNVISIDKKNPNRISLCESDYNTATLFVLPLIFGMRSECTYIENNVGYLINCYVRNSMFEPKDGNSIFLLLKYVKSDRFKACEERLFSHKSYVKKFDVSNDYVIYEFSIPEKFHQDYKMILDGKYSEISNIAKNRIKFFHLHNVDDKLSAVEGSLVNSIFTKDIRLVKHLEKKFGMSMDGLELYKKIDDNEYLTDKVL